MAKTPIEKLQDVDGTKGPMFGTLIIIVVLLVGGATVFYGQFKKSQEWQKTYNENAPAVTETMPQTNASTSLDTLETDLQTTDLSALDADIDSLPTTVE